LVGRDGSASDTSFVCWSARVSDRAIPHHSTTPDGDDADHATTSHHSTTPDGDDADHATPALHNAPDRASAGGRVAASAADHGDDASAWSAASRPLWKDAIYGERADEKPADSKRHYKRNLSGGWTECATATADT